MLSPEQIEIYEASIKSYAQYQPLIAFERSPKAIAGYPTENTQRVVAVGGTRQEVSGGVPPVDNMGVLITSHAAQDAKIDWLSFTIQPNDRLDTMGIVAHWSAILLGGTPMDRGRYGYTSCRAVLGTGVILWNYEHTEMGVHIELPSKALGAFTAATDNQGSVYDIIVAAFRDGAKFKRVDICSDNYEVGMPTVVAAAEDGYLVTRSRSVQLLKNLRGAGMTLYVGAPTSDRRVRFYDKAAEQKLSDVTWTRAEVQLRSDYADQAVRSIMMGGSLETFISSAVDFRLDDDSNVTRRTQLAWWSDWVGAFGRFRFIVSCVRNFVDEAKVWITNQVAPTLAFIMLADGYDMGAGWLVRTIEDAITRIPKYRRSFLQAC